MERLWIVLAPSRSDMTTTNPHWVDHVIRIRKVARESYPRHIVSMRASIQGAKMLDRGYSQEQVEKEQLVEIARQLIGTNSAFRP